MVSKLKQIVTRNNKYPDRKPEMIEWTKSKDKSIARPDGFYFKKTKTDMTDYHNVYGNLLITNANVEASTRKSRPLSKTLSQFTRTTRDTRVFRQSGSKKDFSISRTKDISTLDRILNKDLRYRQIPRDCDLYILPSDIPTTHK